MHCKILLVVIYLLGKEKEVNYEKSIKHKKVF